MIASSALQGWSSDKCHPFNFRIVSVWSPMYFRMAAKSPVVCSVLLCRGRWHMNTFASINQAYPFSCHTKNTSAYIKQSFCLPQLKAEKIINLNFKIVNYLF
jgi:hypothetical protein